MSCMDVMDIEFLSHGLFFVHNLQNCFLYVYIVPALTHFIPTLAAAPTFTI